IGTPGYDDHQARLYYDLHASGRFGVFVIGSSDRLHVLDSDPDAATSTALDGAIQFFRVIGNYARPFGGDLELVLSPAWGRDTAPISGAQAEDMGPFT